MTDVRPLPPPWIMRALEAIPAEEPIRHWRDEDPQRLRDYPWPKPSIEAWTEFSLVHVMEQSPDVKWLRRQLRINSRMRPDIIARVEPEGEDGWWAVTEIKGTRANRAALAQLVGYVTYLSLHLPGDNFIGYLVAPDFEADVIREARGCYVLQRTPDEVWRVIDTWRRIAG